MKKSEAASGSAYDLVVSKKAALLTATTLILLGLAGLFADTFNMMPPILRGYPGDAFYPRIVLGFSALFAVVILVRGVFLPQEAAAVGDESRTFEIHWLELLTVLGLALIYIAVLEQIGFELATTVLLFCLIAPRLLMPPVRALVIGFVAALATMLFLYVCFAPLLGVYLPLTFLPRQLSF